MRLGKGDELFFARFVHSCIRVNAFKRAENSNTNLAVNTICLRLLRIRGRAMNVRVFNRSSYSLTTKLHKSMCCNVISHKWLMIVSGQFSDYFMEVFVKCTEF